MSSPVRPTMLQGLSLSSAADFAPGGLIPVDAQKHGESGLGQKPTRQSIWQIACAVLLLALAAPLFADTPPPARVGRVGFVDGEVSFYADRNEGWQRARVNFPVTSRNSIWTNGVGRAEVRVGASAFRISDESILDVVRLDDARTDLFLQRGSLNVRLRSYRGDEEYRDNVRVETSEGVVQLQMNGRYRIDASSQRDETRVAVFAGQARFESSTGALTIAPGRTLVVRGGTIPSFNFAVASETVFDRWAETRDQRWDDAHQRVARDERVSPYMTGYEDLDAYGDWVEDREYGRVWAPRVVATGWVPYRYGSWAYVRPWGWTWIDDAAWGFAPFHYGRWVYRHSRWYWWPGRYVLRPVYAPALVGWYGRGNWSVSLSVGTPIGWFPLAPREHFVPTYSNNVTYIRNINNINITNVTNNVTVINPPSQFQNQNVGVTTVNSRVVVNGEPVWQTASIGSGQQRMAKPAVDGVSLVPPPAPSGGGVSAPSGGVVAAPSANVGGRAVRGEPLDPTANRGGSGSMSVGGEPVRAVPNSLGSGHNTGNVGIVESPQVVMPRYAKPMAVTPQGTPLTTSTDTPSATIGGVPRATVAPTAVTGMPSNVVTINPTNPAPAPSYAKPAVAPTQISPSPMATTVVPSQVQGEPLNIFPRTERLDSGGGRQAPRIENRPEQRPEQRVEPRREQRNEARQENRPEARIGGGAKPQAEPKPEARGEAKQSGGKVMAEHGHAKPARD